VPHQAVALIEALGVDTIQMPHQPREIALPRVQDQVVVIAHLAIRQHLSIEALNRLRQHFKMQAPVFVVTVDGLASIAARCDVIDGAGEFQAEGAGHEETVPGLGAKGKT
jgi:hypothetical protein